MTLVNDDSRVVNKLETSLTDDAKVVIYDRHMFIVQATSFTYFCIFCLSSIYIGENVSKYVQD